MSSMASNGAAGRAALKIREHMSIMDHRDITSKKRLPEELMALLGCPYLGLNSSLGLIVPPVHAENIETVGDALVKVMQLVLSNLDEPACDVASVLSGLYRNNCWQICLREESTTYAMAAMLFEFVEGYAPSLRLDHYTGPDVRNLLNAWIRPVVQWVELPSKSDLAGYLSGGAWSMIRLSSMDRAVGEMVYQERPPFLPGLCPAQNAILSAQLPDDLCFGA